MLLRKVTRPSPIMMYPVYFISDIVLILYVSIYLNHFDQTYFRKSKKIFSFSRYSTVYDFFPSLPQFPDSVGQMKPEQL